ncbi:Cubilin like [Pseudolycoriella hygida]|uniref:Cubilin like n=1 Tax=Pseudolycoriella hygida TaxID=35572 RepID=A0A9Q0N5F4_9DIPT|nr:Cubilin like [Pseudolycoriella hygida]
MDEISLTRRGQISGNYGNLNCSNEYIHIFEGPFPTERQRRICSQSPTILANYTIPRWAGGVFIEYHSTNYNPNTSFDITIKASYSICGGIISPPIFEFSNPTNGSQYPNNIECIWDITTSIGYHIGVSFVNRFFLEDSVNCTKDYVELLDFVDNNWKLLGRICGRSAPKPFNSTGSQMRLIFRTNENVAGEGFTVKWEEDCGGIFYVSKESQSLESPRYPYQTPPFLKCNYTLVAGKEDYINIDFHEFNLQNTHYPFCVNTNLSIYNYEEWVNPLKTPILVGVYCRKKSLTHIRYKHKIHLIFSSDPFNDARRFSSIYYMDNCGGNVTNSSMIEVPRKESGKYADYLTCLWYLKAPANNKIVIRFEYFELEHNDRCYLDSVEVFQGLMTDPDQRRAVLCGNLTQHAPVVNIKSNNAIVKFHSNGDNNNGGFSALILFSENCDKTIELNDKSPSYILNQTWISYPPHLDCHYVITVPDGYVVNIEFEHFHLAPCHNDTSCTCDYVAILDGSDTFAEAIDKNLCGHSLPQTVTSSGRSLFVRYVTGALSFEKNSSLKLTAVHAVESPIIQQIGNGPVMSQQQNVQNYLVAIQPFPSAAQGAQIMSHNVNQPSLEIQVPQQNDNFRNVNQSSFQSLDPRSGAIRQPAPFTSCHMQGNDREHFQGYNQTVVPNNQFNVGPPTTVSIHQSVVSSQQRNSAIPPPVMSTSVNQSNMGSYLSFVSNHQPNGEARDIVKSKLGQTEAVPWIMSTLQKVFGRPETVLKAVIKRIRNLPPIKDDGLKSMMEFAFEIQSVTTTIESSGVLSQFTNPSLLDELVDKLIAQVKLKWAQYKCEKRNVTTKTFTEWLDELADDISTVVEPTVEKHSKNVSKTSEKGNEKESSHMWNVHMEGCL